MSNLDPTEIKAAVDSGKWQTDRIVLANVPYTCDASTGAWKKSTEEKDRIRKFTFDAIHDGVVQDDGSIKTDRGPMRLASVDGFAKLTPA